MASALGLVQLKKLDHNNERRREITKEYREGSKDTPWISIPFQNSIEKSSYHIFPILLSENISRNEFIERLKEKGNRQAYITPPIHLFTYYKKRFGYKEGMLPQTEYASKYEVTLPLHPNISDEDLWYVTNTIKEILQS